MIALKQLDAVLLCIHMDSDSDIWTRRIFIFSISTFALILSRNDIDYYRAS